MPHYARRRIVSVAAALASDARIVQSDGRWDIKGDPTEGALVVAAKAGLNKSDLDTQSPRVNEIPFTSETKRMTILHSALTGIVAYSTCTCSRPTSVKSA